MTTLAKILTTIGAVGVFLIIFALILYAFSEDKNSKVPAVIGGILVLGLIAGIRAIWKRTKEDNDEQKLDKT